MCGHGLDFRVGGVIKEQYVQGLGKFLHFLG